jgi:hypothetical protein
MEARRIKIPSQPQMNAVQILILRALNTSARTFSHATSSFDREPKEILNIL